MHSIQRWPITMVLVILMLFGSPFSVNVLASNHYDTICDNYHCKRERYDDRKEAEENQKDLGDEIKVTPINTASPCRTFSSTKLRRIRIEERIERGMKEKDVRKSWGKPNQVNHLAKDYDQWFYRRFGESYYLYFRDGCLERWH